MTSLIEDYAMIGDCETAALVSRAGSIDWLCWPRFDSGACFAALLGTPDHGRWRIAPRSPDVTVRRRYRPGTLILETEIETAEGAATLVDFMPLRDGASDIVRLVIGRRGKLDLRTELRLRFEYGARVPWVSRMDDGRWRAIAGPDMAVLDTKVALRFEDRELVGDFCVQAGEQVSFALRYGPSYLPFPAPVDAAEALQATQDFWLEWSGRCTYSGPWREAVMGSLLVLKALTYGPTGGVVAAPTTSLPECLGGNRNWDYRFCWVRDATFTLLALMDAGYHDEARAWLDWLLRAVAGSPQQMQIMYSITGRRHLHERELDSLPGFAGSAPVRIGNAAHSQRQLDVFGELMDAMHQARRAHLIAGDEGWALARVLMDHVEQIWQEPDEGIWEVRGPSRNFTHSKIMVWAALDRAISSAEEFRLQAPLERWRALRARVHDEVCRAGYSAEKGCFVQAYGSAELDASLLLLPLVGFLPATDPRVLRTVEAIERELTVEGLVIRYNTHRADDGLPPGEGAFLACSFWLADNYAMQGRCDEARRLFERLLALRNDVGLLAEEYDPRGRRQLGNFPQAFSHLALIDTAYNLAQVSGPAEQRGEGAARPKRAA